MYDPLIFDVSASIDASVSLAEIYQYGVLGPIDRKKELEFYELAATKYGDATSAVNAGWAYFSDRDVYDLEKAIKITQIAEKSAEPIMRAYAKNNLGVMHKDMLSEDSESISLEYYKEAAELFLQQDYAQPWPFENLARANLLNAKGDGVNVRKLDVGLSSRSKMVGMECSSIYWINTLSIQIQNTKLIIIGCSMKQNWVMTGPIWNSHGTLKIFLT